METNELTFFLQSTGIVWGRASRDGPSVEVRTIQVEDVSTEIQAMKDCASAGVVISP